MSTLQSAGEVPGSAKGVSNLQSTVEDLVVSKNCSAALMGFEAVELEVGGKPPAEFSQSRQQLTRLRALCDLKRARPGDVNFNIVAFLL